MSPEDIKLHAALIRYTRGLINAWEEWVKAHMKPPLVEEDPDPEKHFKQINQQTRR